MLRRLLVTAALLLGVTAAIPATADAPVTFTGKAGTYTEIRLAKPMSFDVAGRDIGLAKADRGDLVGLALVSPSGGDWLVYSKGQVMGSICRFGTPCDRYDFPSVDSSSRYDGAGRRTLPAGTYRVALIGRPGANVQVSVTLPGLSGTVSTTKAARLTVEDLSTLYPSTADQQPKSVSDATYAGKGPVVAGVSLRVDTATAKSAVLDYCLSDGFGPQLPGGTVCSGGSLTTGAMGVYYYSCPDQPLPTFVCLPAGVDTDAVSFGVATVQTGQVRMVLETETRAVKSHVALTAFALSF